jgi:hypothetical protein
MNLRPWRGTPSHRSSGQRLAPGADDGLLAMVGPAYHAAYQEALGSKVTPAQVAAMMTVATTTFIAADAQYAASNREAAAGLFCIAREFFGDAALSAHRLMATRIQMLSFLGVAEAGTRLISLRLTTGSLGADDLRAEAELHAGTALGHFRHVREPESMVRAYLVLGRLALCYHDLPQALAFVQRARSTAAFAGLSDLVLECQALHRFVSAMAPGESPSGSRLRIDAPAIVRSSPRDVRASQGEIPPSDGDHSTRGVV